MRGRLIALLLLLETLLEEGGPFGVHLSIYSGVVISLRSCACEMYLGDKRNPMAKACGL